LSGGLPRPWTALIFGGHTTRARLELPYAEWLIRTVRERVQRRGGSLLVTTSPRTPHEVLWLLKLRPAIPGVLHLFSPRNPAINPYGAYLNLADELIVTGDSGSMIAECWRSGRPLWVAPLPRPLHRRCARRLRSLVPRSFIASGIVAADIDIDPWLNALASDGDIGLLDVCDPSRPYSRSADHDLTRTVGRIRALL
jgi:mitochondrial fission protein ELM1